MPAEGPAALLVSGATRVHVVGIGGAGMSAIAIALAELGHQVSGSDRLASATTARLSARGIEVTIGHRAHNLKDAHVVTASPAVGPDNVELAEGHRRGIVLSRASVLAAIASTRRCAAVAGTHGKTTTASMLSLVLLEAGLQPSFLVGADVGDLGTNARVAEGEWMVIEADESYGSFAELSPQLSVLTSVEPDHLDHYGNLEGLRSAFLRLMSSTAGPRIVCIDDPMAAQIAPQIGALGVGESPEAHYRMHHLVGAARSVRFELEAPGRSLGPITVGVPGRHNASNAALAAAAALEIGAPIDSVRQALSRFAGVPRRFERRGSVRGVSFIDDYGHLPGEIVPTLATARLVGRRVVAVFQPHRYTRTQALATHFAHAFDDADIVVITDIYSAGEAAIAGVSASMVADAVAAIRGPDVVYYAPDRQELRALLVALLRAGDVCVTLGAGDLTTLPDELMIELAR